MTAPNPYRDGYVYRYPQGRVPVGRQVPPAHPTREDRIKWAQGWKAADDDLAKGTPSRFPLPAPPPPAEEPPSEPARAPRVLDPEPEPPSPVVAVVGPRVVSVVKRPGIEPPPRTPRVVPVAAPPPSDDGRAPAWLTLRIHREGSGYRIDSEGADEELQGNALPALNVAIQVHLGGRLGGD